MKIYSKEYCSACNKDGIWEYEDLIVQQYTECPHCRTKHFRQLLESTIVNLRQYKPRLVLR